MIRESDIDSILSGAIGEGQHLDFKTEVDLDNKDKKSAIIDDTVAFLNGGGGQILIGLQEDRKTGSVTLNPVTGDADSYCLKLQQILKSNISAEPRDLRVDAFTVSGGHIINIYIRENNNKPYCNKISGRYLTRNGRKNEPLLPGEVRALSDGKVKLIEEVGIKTKRQLAKLTENEFFELNCPWLYISILPLQSQNLDALPFNHSVSSHIRKSMTAPHGRSKAFQRVDDGFEVDAIDMDRNKIGRFFVGDDWFMQSIMCHPVPFDFGAARIKFEQMREELSTHLEDIRYFLADEKINGPFAIEGAVQNLHSRDHFIRLFPRAKSISLGRPLFMEVFDRDALVTLIYDRIYQASIYGS